MQSDASNVPPLSSPGGSIVPQEMNTISPANHRPGTRRQSRLLPALGVLVLLTLLGLGWRWWSGRAAAPAGPAAGMQQSQGLPVKLETLKSATLVDYSEFIGSLDAKNSVEIRPEITGRVSQIYVAKGERVQAGTPLVQLSPNEQTADLASVVASINAARASRSNARSQLETVRANRVAQVAEVDLQQENFRRTSTLVSKGALSQQDLDQARRNRDTAVAQLKAVDRQIEAAQAGLSEAEAGVAQAEANANRSNAQLQQTTIVAPFDGIVGDIPVRLGSVVTNSDLLTTLTRNQSLNLRLSIPLERSPELQTGQRVELVDNTGNVLQTGRVSFIAPRVESNAQSVLAEATFDNPGGQLRDGQFVRARVIWSERPGILVPASAITRLAGEPFVFVAKKPDPTKAPPAGQAGKPGAAPGPAPALVAQQRQVRLGSIQGNSYQVLEGLEAGEQVVVSGILNLANGAPIMPAPPDSEKPTGSAAPAVP